MKDNYCTILFFIRKARLNKQRESPTLVRITINGMAQESVIGRSITPKLWNQKTERANGKDAYSREINAYIVPIRNRILQIHRQ